MRNVVLFDLDGTLLPMKQEEFVQAYMVQLCRAMAPLGYEPKKLVKTVLRGTDAMVKNDGSVTNETAFWRVFEEAYGKKALERDYDRIMTFYTTDFEQVKRVCGFDPRARMLIDRMRAHSIRRVLATNPLFPACAVEARLRWAGLRPEDFSYITTYENSTYCKPNPAYFQEILEKTGLYAEQCIYIGNDAVEDLPARQLGIPTFLLTDNLICPDDRLLEYIPYGDYTKLERFMRSHMFA